MQTARDRPQSACYFVCFSPQSCFRFSRMNGLFAAIRPSAGHPSICAQSAQVASPFSRTQLCTGQSLSQNGVFTPSMRQPVQQIMSGVIGTPFSFVHNAAVFSRSTLSFVIVATRASQVSQSSPQQPIRWFMRSPPCIPCGSADGVVVSRRREILFIFEVTGNLRRATPRKTYVPAVEVSKLVAEEKNLVFYHEVFARRSLTDWSVRFILPQNRIICPSSGEHKQVGADGRIWCE